MSSKKIVKSNAKISTQEFAKHRGAISLGMFNFADDMFDKIEKTDRISVRVGSRRKLFRISKIELEDSVSEYPSMIILHPKEKKNQ